MSTSFGLINGDIPITAGRSFQTVSARDKLSQDLALWILERFGIDPDNPTWGSHLDDYIGNVNNSSTLNNIRNEVIRILQQYQAMQFSDIQRDIVTYGGKTTIAPEETLSSINSVTVINNNTVIIVQVKISTLSGTTLQVTLPISTT